MPIVAAFRSDRNSLRPIATSGTNAMINAQRDPNIATCHTPESFEMTPSFFWFSNTCWR